MLQRLFQKSRILYGIAFGEGRSKEIAMPICFLAGRDRKFGDCPVERRSGADDKVAADAVVISLKTRSNPSDAAIAESLAALK